MIFNLFSIRFKAGKKEWHQKEKMLKRNTSLNLSSLKKEKNSRFIT